MSRPIALAALGLALLCIAPAAFAQAPAAIANGSQLKTGDLDWVPTAKADSVAMTVREVVLGSSAIDDCVILNGLSKAATILVDLNDLYLTSCMGHRAGTAVDSHANLVKATSIPITPFFVYVDVDGSASYNKGDGSTPRPRTAPWRCPARPAPGPSA